MTYWWNEIGDRISLFNLADICPKCVKMILTQNQSTDNQRCICASLVMVKTGSNHTSLGRSYLLALLVFSIGFRIFSIKS